MTESDQSQVQIRQALAGEPRSLRALVDRLSPDVAKRVAAALWQWKRRRDVAQEVGDMVQEVFLSLFQAEGKALRAWDPARGMSLDRFVGMLAQHQVVSIMRSGRTSPWRDDPTEPEKMESLGESPTTPESIAISREKLQVLLARLRGELSPRGLELFQRIIVDEESVDTLISGTGLTPAAIYQWKSRLTRRLKELADELEAPAVSEAGADPRKGKGTPRGTEA